MAGLTLALGLLHSKLCFGQWEQPFLAQHRYFTAACRGLEIPPNVMGPLPAQPTNATVVCREWLEVSIIDTGWQRP